MIRVSSAQKSVANFLRMLQDSRYGPCGTGPIDSVGVSAVQKFVKGSSWSYGDKWNKTPLFYKLVGAFSNVLLFTMRYYIPDVDVSFGFLSLSRLSLFPIDELLTIH